MFTQAPIFSTKEDHKQIGYIQGNEAFDLSGQKRCNYNPETGNLNDPCSGRIVGHITLRGKLLGPSWIADRLFCASSGRLEAGVQKPILPQPVVRVFCERKEVTNLRSRNRDTPPSHEQPLLGVVEPVGLAERSLPLSRNHDKCKNHAEFEAVAGTIGGEETNNCDAGVQATAAAPDHELELLACQRKPTHWSYKRTTLPKKTLSSGYYRHRAEVLRFALITTHRAEAIVRLRAYIEKYRALADRAALRPFPSEISEELASDVKSNKQG